MGVDPLPPTFLSADTNSSAGQSGTSTPLRDVAQDLNSSVNNITGGNGPDLGIGVEHFAYPCVYSSYQGNLYAGSDAVAFQGTLFFLERKFLLNWQDVLHVQKTEQLGIITVVTRDDVVYKFGQVQHPERVWSQLLSLHNSALLDNINRFPCLPPKSEQETPASHRRSARMSIRRMNSDPLQASRAALTADDFEDPSKILTPSEAFSQNSKTSNEQKYNRAVTVPIEEASVTGNDLQKSWAELSDNTEVSFPDLAIKDHELECSLDTFFSLFLADDAKYSMPNFMTSNGDTEVKSSPWKVADDGQSHCRTVEYSHPVNAPLAPPRARARKEQCYRKYGPHGLSLVTDTYVEDVPMTDCFYVHDRIRIQPKGTSAVTLHFEFDIRFVKTTMFKAIIARTTRSEFKRFGQKLADFMSQALAAPNELTEMMVATTASTDSALTAAGTGFASSMTRPPLLPTMSAVPNWTLVLVVVVLLLHTRLMLDMRQMKRSMMQMEGTMLALNHQLTTCTVPSPTTPSLQ